MAFESLLDQCRSVTGSGAELRWVPSNVLLAAGVEDHDVESCARTFHLPQHQIAVEHLKIHVRFLGRICADRNQIIRSSDLHAVASVIEQRNIGALRLRPEILD